MATPLLALEGDPMNKIDKRSFVSIVSLFLAGAVAGCAVPASDLQEPEELGSAEEAIHEATCLDTSNDGILDYDAYTYWSFPGGCGGSGYGTSLGTSSSTYGVSTCPGQFRARFGLGNGWRWAQPSIVWPSTATELNESNCGVASVRASFWAKRRDNGSWDRLPDTEQTGQWKNNTCVFNYVSGFGDWPVIEPSVYSELNVAADARYLFLKQPLKVQLATGKNACP
ncbi:Hypothetical protein A7982_05741 [Minicystis rosea]|nr:Hypothetical protein A7982_05741 [Minicystis rosea]